jgi:adenylate cyclase
VILGLAQAPAGQAGAVAGKAGFVQIGANPGQVFPTLRATTAIVPVLQAAATGIGGINVDPEGESDVIRTVPIAWNAPAGLLPSLPIEVLRVALGESTIEVHGPATAEGVIASVRVGAYEVPTTPDGRIWLRYRHDTPALYVSARAVLAPGRDADLEARLRGHIVLIGASAAGLLDIRTTALGETVPGVSIQAQILEQILTHDVLQRGDFEAGIEIIAFLCLSGIVVAVMSMSGPAVSMAAGGVAALAVLATSWLFFGGGQLFDATFPMIGGFTVFLLLAGYQFIVADRDKRLIRRSFSHYVAPAVLQDIERKGHHPELGGQMRTVTVMFCDLRDFTPLSETMAPTDLVAMLNSLFSQLSDCVLEAGGTIDKFVGDSLMAFWNAPLETPDHRERACRAALNIRASLRAFNAARQRAGQTALAVAVGLATGPACVGNIGARQRYSYSAIGDTVNVAARIEAACRHIAYDLVLCGQTRAGSAAMATLAAGNIRLKGKQERAALHILVGDAAVARDPAFARLRSLHETLLGGLARSGGPAPEALAACLRAAAAVEP